MSADTRILKRQGANPFRPGDQVKNVVTGEIGKVGSVTREVAGQMREGVVLDNGIGPWTIEHVVFWGTVAT